MNAVGRGLDRRLELLRGRVLRWRGAVVGHRFGLGRRCRVEFPECLVVADDVSISDDGYLHCLSEMGVRIGARSSIDPRVWLHCGGRPGERAGGYFALGHDSFIGANGVIGAGGGVSIGNNVLVGQCVNFHAEQHQFRSSGTPIRLQGVSFGPIHVEDDVWIGSKATILAGVTIGTGSVVGAGAVVTRSVPPYSIAVGVPARVIGSR